MPVAVPAGAHERLTGGEDPRPGHPPGVDRRSQGEVGAVALGDAPHRRHAGLEGAAGPVGHVEGELEGRHAVERVAQLTRQGEGEVGVHVHQAGGDERTGEVDDRGRTARTRLGEDGGGAAHGADPPRRHPHRGVRQRRRAGAVDHRARREHALRATSHSLSSSRAVHPVWRAGGRRAGGPYPASVRRRLGERGGTGPARSTSRAVPEGDHPVDREQVGSVRHHDHGSARRWRRAGRAPAAGRSARRGARSVRRTRRRGDRRGAHGPGRAAGAARPTADAVFADHGVQTLGKPVDPIGQPGLRERARRWRSAGRRAGPGAGSPRSWSRRGRRPGHTIRPGVGRRRSRGRSSPTVRVGATSSTGRRSGRADGAARLRTCSCRTRSVR